MLCPEVLGIIGVVSRMEGIIGVVSRMEGIIGVVSRMVWNHLCCVQNDKGSSVLCPE